MQVVDINGNVFGPGLQITGPDGKPKTINSGTPIGPAGGDLSGTYPNPSVVWNNGTSTYGLLYYPLSTNPSGFITASALTPYLTITLAASTYYPIPTGTISQYIRGDGTLATLPTITSGTVTSVGLSMPSAFTVGSSPITTSGTIAVTGAGVTSQYIRGDGTLDTFPTIPTVNPDALTKTDDTNVTLTLGGSPSVALLKGTSLTLGWTGTLADSRITSAATWNAKQAALSGSGIVKSTGGTISYLTDNSTDWNTAYTNRITSLTTTGSGAATLTSNVLNIPIPSTTTLNPQVVGFSVANGTTITGPGSTSPRISTQITIPAGTLATNSIIEMLWMSIRLSGAGGIIQSAVYLSTSSGTLGSSPTVGATLLATGANMTSTQIIVKLVRDLNKQSTSGTVANAATQYGSDFGLQTVVTSFTINNSSTLYLQFCVSSTGPADTSCIRNIRITEYKAV